MDLEQLTTFLSLTTTKNFTRTAEELNVVQSTVTTRIKMLEECIGKKLFIRKTRTVEMTEAGRIFLTYAKQTIELMKEGIEAARIQTRFQNRIVIGGLNSVWDSPISDLVKEYYKLNNQTAFRLITGHSQDIINKILNGVIDVGFVYTSPRSSSFKVFVFGEESISLVASPEVAEAINNFQLEDMHNFPTIHYNWGFPFSEWFEQEIGKQETMRLRVDHTAMYLRMLVEGAGIGFLTDNLAEPLIKKGRLRRIPFVSVNLPPSRKIYITYLSKNEERVRTFLDYLFQRRA